jgi:hypothetical protein
MIKRSALVLATLAAATFGLVAVASPASADCLTYHPDRSYHVSVPTPYGPAEADVPAVTDVNPQDCVRLILGD